MVVISLHKDEARIANSISWLAFSPAISALYLPSGLRVRLRLSIRVRLGLGISARCLPSGLRLGLESGPPLRREGVVS